MFKYGVLITFNTNEIELHGIYDTEEIANKAMTCFEKIKSKDVYPIKMQIIKVFSGRHESALNLNTRMKYKKIWKNFIDEINELKNLKNLLNKKIKILKNNIKTSIVNFWIINSNEQ